MSTRATRVSDGLIYWELTLPMFVLQLRNNYSLGTGWVWRQWKKFLFASLGWPKDDIIWKSLVCRVVNGVPRGSPAAKSWPWDFPRDSIHHSTPSPFPNKVPVVDHWSLFKRNIMQGTFIIFFLFSFFFMIKVSRAKSEINTHLKVESLPQLFKRICWNILMISLSGLQTAVFPKCFKLPLYFIWSRGDT